MLSEDHKEIASGKKKDDEGYMARIELDNIEKSISKLRKTIKSSGHQLPAWVQSKITRAADYIDSAAEYLSSDEELDESKVVIQASFLTPLTNKILKEMGCDCDMKKPSSVDEIAKKHKTSVERINKQLKQGIKVEMEHTTDKNEAETIALQHLAERPDYYTRLKKVEQSTELNEVKNKSVKDSNDKDPCWDGYQQRGMKKKGRKMVPNCVPVNEGVRIQSKSGQLMNIMLNWRNKVILTQLFFPQVRIPKRLEIMAAVEKVYPGAKVLTFRVSDINPNLPLVQVNEEEAWQKANRKDRVDGLSQKAVNAYRREHPGSKLQTAVTEKNPKGKRKKRRKSFCSRSDGQRKMHKIKCSKTPKKPICKARRRWRC